MAFVNTSAGAVISSVAVGTLIAYAEITANVTVSATTDAAPTTVITAPTFIADGGTSYWVEFFSPIVSPGAGPDFVVFNLFDSATQLGRLGSIQLVTSVQFLARRKVTPSSGPRTYIVGAFRNVANGTVGAGAWGAATAPPAYVAITKAA